MRQRGLLTYHLYVRVFTVICGSRCKPGRDSDFGFSLMEVVVNLFLLSILSALTIRVLLSMWTSAATFMAYASSENDWRNISRTLTHDVHSAIAGEVQDNVLNLTLVDGTRYRYYLNSRTQLIRYGSGSGTSVLGNEVQGFTCRQNQQTMTVTVQLQGLPRQTLTLDTLRVMVP